MPNQRTLYMDRMRNVTGWGSAVYRDVKKGERSIFMDRNDGTDLRVMIMPHRRARHDNGDGTFADIDTDWQVAAAGRELYVNQVGPVTLRAGGRDTLDFQNQELLRYYKDGTWLLSLTPAGRLFWDDIGHTVNRTIRNSRSVIGELAGPAQQDKLIWREAYGAGFNYEMKAEPDLILNELRVNRLSRLGRWNAGEFFVKSHKVDVPAGTKIIYTNASNQYVEWDQLTTVSTRKAIRFRDSSDVTLFGMKQPWIRSTDYNITVPGRPDRKIVAGNEYDHLGNLLGEYSFYRLREESGNIWLDACFYPDNLPTNTPLFFDPPLELDIAVVDSLTAYWNSYGSSVNATAGIANTAIYGGGITTFLSNWDMSALDGDETIESNSRISVVTGGVDAGCDIDAVIEDTLDSTFVTTDAQASTRQGNWHLTTQNHGTPTGSARQSVEFGLVLAAVFSDNSGTVGEMGLDFDPSPGTNSNIAAVYTGSQYGASYDPDVTIYYYEPAGGAATVIYRRRIDEG